ncbi:MAG: hypothetical protein MMC33_010511 [Icmadophila ericetorum]|nr:hypothetical protein [Icmadophila ericetorum]
MLAFLTGRTSPKYSRLSSKSPFSFPPQTSIPPSRLIAAKSTITLTALALLTSLFLSAYAGYSFAQSTFFSPIQIPPFGPLPSNRHLTPTYNVHLQHNFPVQSISNFRWRMGGTLPMATRIFPASGFRAGAVRFCSFSSVALSGNLASSFLYVTRSKKNQIRIACNQADTNRVTQNSLRKGYWLLLNNKLQRQQDTDSNHDPDSAMITSPGHVQHYIEYLRQALICHVDTNIEPVIQELHGVKGFGVEHVCRDYESVKAWTGTWAGYGQ